MPEPILVTCGSVRQAWACCACCTGECEGETPHNYPCGICQAGSD